MGPNFFIWIAIAVVAASAALSVISDQDWIAWIGFPIGLALAIVNKVRAKRRARAELNRSFD